MTRKRFNKLTRAYFTRLNEWAKETGEEPLKMGRVYRNLQDLPDNLGEDEFGRKITRQEWWETLNNIGEPFGIGIKTK